MSSGRPESQIRYFLTRTDLMNFIINRVTKLSILSGVDVINTQLLAFAMDYRQYFYILCVLYSTQLRIQMNALNMNCWL